MSTVSKFDFYQALLQLTKGNKEDAGMIFDYVEQLAPGPNAMGQILDFLKAYFARCDKRDVPEMGDRITEETTPSKRF